MTTDTTDIPAGFEPHFRNSPVTDAWAPLYAKKTDKAVIIGLRLAKPHTNGRGLIHGGLIAALIESDVIKTGSTICFAQCLIKADDVTIARANGTFRVVPKPASAT